MQRRAVQTRIATAVDVDVLAMLAGELRCLGARSERAVNPLDLADPRDRFAGVVEGREADVILACDGDEVAGFAVVRVVQLDPLSPTLVLQLSNMVVSEGHRRRGVGHALIAAATDYATARGVDHLAAGVYPSLREASRFLARLGFAPVAVERVAAVTALQRRLGPPTTLNLDDRARRVRLRTTIPTMPQRRKLRAMARSSD